MDARMAARRLSALADHDRSRPGPACHYDRDRLPGHLLLRRAEERTRRRSPSTRSIPRSSRPTRSSASRCASRRSWPASSRQHRVAVDAVFDSVSVATTFKEELAKAGVIFMPISEAIREHPELVRKYLGTVVPVTDNFFATLNSAVFSDGSFVYMPPGVRCPMELSTYFRINEQNTGQFERTLIIADKGSYVSLPRGLHGAQARREPAPRRGGRARRARRRRDQVLDGPELVPGRRRGQGRHLQLRHQARRLPRQELEDLLDAGRDRLGDHLEVPVLHPARRRLARRVLLDRGVERHAAGRFRHQDDPSRQEHHEPDHLQGHLGGQVAEHLSRPGLGPPQGDRARATSPTATRC